MSRSEAELLKSALTRERKARQEAETLLEEMSRELYEYANKQKNLDREANRTKRIEMISNLSAVIAHDLNNAISVIESFTNFIKEDVDKIATADDVFNKIDQNITNIFKACTQARDIALRTSKYAQKQQEQTSIINLTKLLEDDLELFEATVRDKQINFARNFNTRKVEVEGSAVQLSEMFMNILHNARDAINNDQGNITVSLTIKKNYDFSKENDAVKYFNDITSSVSTGITIFNNRVARIEIKDDGCGIEQEIINRIFMPYVSSKSKSTVSGIGLFGVESIISIHGGGVRYTTLKNHGTVCEIVIPIADDEIIKILSASNQSKKKSKKLKIIRKVRDITSWVIRYF